ncbi:amino acid ABC transporter [Gluconobacter morbifer G707]|uniref:Amino acid ABC transporter n=2 Tax=Gluconobacter TaxID=441 RepID=G6XL55_9PROT|nr:amino acid ABC transporter [Gluconobacter morbifer G707]
MIALGGVMGAGYFVGSSAALSLGGPAVLISYSVTGTFVFLVNMMMRDLARKVPGRASFLQQIRYALGDRIGFVAGWAYWLTWVTVIAIEVIAVATMLTPFIPLPYAALELIVLAAMTGLNLLSVRGYGEFEYWFAAIKVFAIAGFIALGCWALGTQDVPVHDNLFAHGGLVPHGWLALLAVIPTILFSMGGSEISTVAAVESDNTEQNIVRATRTIAFRILGLYLTSVTLILCLVPWSDVTSGQSPFLLVLHRLHVPFADLFMTIVILTAALSSLNSGIYVTSRILHELARDGDAPRLFLPVDPDSHLPRRAILGSVLSSVGVAVMAVLSPSVIFALLVSLTGAFMVFNNMLLIVGRLKLVPERPLTSYAALLLSACILVAMIMQPETRSQIEVGSVAIIVILLVASVRQRLRKAQNNRP